MFNYSGWESKKRLSVCDSDTAVILKQGQGHQTWYELVNYKQGYIYAKFEKPRLNAIHEKAIVNILVKSGNTSIISFEFVRKSRSSCE